MPISTTKIALTDISHITKFQSDKTTKAGTAKKEDRFIL
jgi:hypothetical protein